MAYKITITKIDTVEYESTKRQSQLRPATEKDLLNLGSYYSEDKLNALIQNGKFPTTEEYINIPCKDTKEVSSEIYQQTVTDLNLQSVIKAINDL